MRGDEVTDLLAAMNTGHRGGCGTLHANSAADVVSRVEGLALAAGLPAPAVHAQLAAGVDAVLHCHRGRDGRRRVVELAVLRHVDDRCVAVTAATFDDAGVHEGPGAAQLARGLQRAGG